MPEEQRSRSSLPSHPSIRPNAQSIRGTASRQQHQIESTSALTEQRSDPALQCIMRAESHQIVVLGWFSIERRASMNKNDGGSAATSAVFVGTNGRRGRVVLWFGRTIGLLSILYLATLVLGFLGVSWVPAAHLPLAGSILPPPMSAPKLIDNPAEIQLPVSSTVVGSSANTNPNARIPTVSNPVSNEPTQPTPTATTVSKPPVSRPTPSPTTSSLASRKPVPSTTTSVPHTLPLKANGGASSDTRPTHP